VLAEGEGLVSCWLSLSLVSPSPPLPNPNAINTLQQTTSSLLGSTSSPGCFCTFQTCKSYYRLENECAELLMIAPAVKALEGFDTRKWAARYDADKVTWPVSGASGKAPVRLLSSREEHRAQVRALIEGATTSICVVAGYAHVVTSPSLSLSLASCLLLSLWEGTFLSLSRSLSLAS